MRGPAIRAGLRYGAEAFSLGFLLGTLRVMLVAPVTGALTAVAIELPVMLLVMAWRAHRIVARSREVMLVGARAIMGVTGFTLLLFCEFVLGMALGTSPRQWLADLASPPGAAGLAGQIVFGCLPLLVGRAAIRVE